MPSILHITCICDSYIIEIRLQPNYLGTLPSLGITYFSFILAVFYKIHSDVISRLRSHYDLFKMLKLIFHFEHYIYGATVAHILSLQLITSLISYNLFISKTVIS